MIRIQINNTHSQVFAPTIEVLNQLRDVLSYEIEGAVFARQKNPYWDGKVRLMDKRGIFPTGLLDRLTEYLKAESFEHSITDQRNIPKPTHKYVFLSKYDSRDYQDKALEASRANPRGVFKMGTGAGKSWTNATIVHDKQVQTLIITPDTGLRNQLYKDFAKWFGSLVSTDIKSNAPIVVANIQSLANKPPDLFKRFQMLCIDEFHHSSATTYQNVNKACSNAYYRYGFTGTFVRPDGSDMEMHGVLSNVIFSISSSELIELGWLVRPYITLFYVDVSNKGRKISMNYKTAYDWITKHEKFNGLIIKTAKEKMAQGKQTLILIRRKEHGEKLAEQIPNSYFLCGDHPTDYRDKIKQAFIDKRIRCVIATSVFGEGIDIPSIDALINGRAQKTEIETVQGIGRALRKHEGKDKAEVFDFLFSGQKHLENHSVERYNTYRKEKAFKIQIRRAVHDDSF